NDNKNASPSSEQGNGDNGRKELAPSKERGEKSAGADKRKGDDSTRPGDSGQGKPPKADEKSNKDRPAEKAVANRDPSRDNSKEHPREEQADAAGAKKTDQAANQQDAKPGSESTAKKNKGSNAEKPGDTPRDARNAAKAKEMLESLAKDLKSTDPEKRK